MTSLTDRAEQSAEPVQPRKAVVSAGSPMPPLPIDMGEFEPGDSDPEMIPVHLAWLRVRKDVRGIAKREKYSAAGTTYNFRGVDTVVQAFSPITMKHGVSVLPVRVVAEYRDTTSKSGSKQRECSVVVTWLIVGPKGDSLELQSAGEALDTQDKGTAKAQSVALRVLLLAAGLTPTGDPDPDSQHIDRGEAPIRQPGSYVDEITNPRTSSARLRQIHAELKAANQLTALVANENGDDEQIGEMVVRIGKERAEQEGGSPV